MRYVVPNAPKVEWDKLDPETQLDHLRTGYRALMLISMAVVAALIFGGTVLIRNDQDREARTDVRDAQFEQIACLDLPYARADDPRAIKLHKVYPQCSFAVYPPKLEDRTITVEVPAPKVTSTPRSRKSSPPPTPARKATKPPTAPSRTPGAMPAQTKPRPNP